MGHLRRAGRGHLADGRLVTWSVAEGSRGRRWRWTVSDDTSLEHAGLIELGHGRSFVRLELETAAAMLTLHPTDDGTGAHGNVVRAVRVDPIAVPWRAGDGVHIVRDPFATALLGGDREALVVEADLTIRMAGGRTVPRGPAPRLQVDERGVPALIDPSEWPLEV